MKDTPSLALVIISTISAFAAIASALIARAVYQTTKKRHFVDSLLTIVDRIESEEKREIRRIVYQLDRSSFEKWEPDIIRKVDEWCAELDLISLLLLSNNIDPDSFFKMYGDVFIRSIYQIAPYVNKQRETRGRQFLLLLSECGRRILRLWKRHRWCFLYPREIKLPAPNSILLSPSILRKDDECRKFLSRPKRILRSLQKSP